VVSHINDTSYPELSMFLDRPIEDVADQIRAFAERKQLEMIVNDVSDGAQAYVSKPDRLVVGLRCGRIVSFSVG
jgi:hypothetical protein